MTATLEAPPLRQETSEDDDRRGRVPTLPPLSAPLDVFRSVLLAVGMLAGAVVLHLVVLSSLDHRAAQQRLYDDFREQLAAGTAPTGPVDLDGAVVGIGEPVAYLEIPEIDLQQVVVSGTTSGALFAGPGHRRDTALPGQAGATVLMGRGAAYGGPFAEIDELDEGDVITVTTGQSGEDGFEYRVLGVRREGDPLPAPPEPDESRLVLTTAEGPPFLPNGVVRVDAAMQGTASRGPGVLFGSLPAAEENMAADTSELWALALWLQVLLAVALAAVWSWHRWGRPQTWVVFVPALLLIGMSAGDQMTRLLPNML